MRVGGDVKAPTLVKRVEPLYPGKARLARLSGAVILQLVIDKAGVVRRIQVLKGLPRGLSEAAADAVMQWEFEPASRGRYSSRGMIVVADSSPLHYLILLEQTNLLQQLYGEVAIPETVATELLARGRR